MRIMPSQFSLFCLWTLLGVSTVMALLLAEKLLTCATGPGLEFSHDAVISDIVRKAKAQKYGFRALLHEIVASSRFQTK